MNQRTGRWLLLLGALGFAIVGQFYFAKRPNNFWDGVVFYTAAVACMLLLTRDAPGTTEAVEAPARRRAVEEWVRIGLAVAGAVLATITVLRLNKPQDSYGPIFWGWLLSIVLVLLAALPPWSELRAAVCDFFLSLRTWEVLFVLGILAAAFALRAWRIDGVPWTVGGDEGSQGLWARDVLAGKLPDMFGLGWLSVPNMSFYWQAAWFRLFGDNVVGLRMPWAVIGAGTVLGTYLLVRRLFDRWLAVLTAALLATYHFHIHYSRLGSNQIADPFFTVWALYFVVIGVQSRRTWPWAVSGVIAGLAFYFYAGSRQAPIILVAVLAWIAVTDFDTLAERGRAMLAMLGTFLVTAGPMALVAIQSPDDFNARLNQVGIFQSGLIDRIAEATGKTRLEVLLEQIRQAFSAFNWSKDRVAWYGPGIPLLQFGASIFFVLGAALSISRLRQWRYALFVIWFVLVVGMGGALTENPPSSQRLVSSAVPVAFFMAVALVELGRTVQSLAHMPRVARYGLAGVAAILISIASINFYFGAYQQSWAYGSFNAEVATRLGYYLRDLGPAYKEYFFGAPRMWADFGSIPFIARGVEIYDVQQAFAGPALDFVDPTHKPVFVFLPERIHELDAVRQLMPGGTVDEVHRIPGDWEQPLLFTAYRLP
ncbi:MAG: ArnT family glycosyltransferase [Nitrososphaerales archaeon]